MALHLGMAFFENGLGLGYTGNGWFLRSSTDVLEHRQLVAVCSLGVWPCVVSCVPSGVHPNTLCAVQSFCPVVWIFVVCEGWMDDWGFP